jgi:putative ABC transport system permease protein
MTATSDPWKVLLVCVVMVAAAAIVYGVIRLGSPWSVPIAAIRAAAQLAAISAILAVSMPRLWSSALVVLAMYIVAVLTAAGRGQASAGSRWLALSLAAGMTSVLPLLLAIGVVPLTGFAIVPVFGIVLGGTMTAVAVAARRALDTLQIRSGEVEAALSLGMSEWDSRMEVMRRALSDALIPNLDQARTAGLVVLPGAFVGVLLSTGSALQACVVQALVLISLMLSQSCAVAVTAALIAYGKIVRQSQWPSATA